MRRSEPVIGAARFLPLGSAAAVFRAKVSSWAFQQPRVEHGLFMRTCDFCHWDEGESDSHRYSRAWRLRREAWRRGARVCTLDATA